MTPSERLEALEKGENPLLIARMKSGFAVMGDSQFLPGYCLLLAHPMIEKLNDLAGNARADFLADMAALGDAVLAATGAVRINYSIYGNLDPFLHAHIFPRYADEEPAFRSIPPMSIPAEIRTDPSQAFQIEKHEHLRVAIARALESAKHQTSQPQ
jgi:diadenosine tetraphosphate (Ap4A) HIT family hydrolase